MRWYLDFTSPSGVRKNDTLQIVIPKKARDIFGLEVGSELLVLGDEEQGIALQRIEDAEAMMQMYAQAINSRVPPSVGHD